MEVALQRPVRDEGVRMVGGADDHGIEALVVQALPPVHVSGRIRETLQRVREAGFIHIAERHDILLADRVVVCEAAAPDADEGDVELVAGRVRSEERACDHASGDQAGCADEPAS
jgi:hypothetical protein